MEFLPLTIILVVALVVAKYSAWYLIDRAKIRELIRDDPTGSDPQATVHRALNATNPAGLARPEARDIHARVAANVAERLGSTSEDELLQLFTLAFRETGGVTPSKRSTKRAVAIIKHSTVASRGTEV